MSTRGLILYHGPENPELNIMLKKAAELSLDLQAVDPRKLSVLVATDSNRLLLDGSEISRPDFVIAAFAHDPSYANMAILRQFETLGVLCVNRASVMQRTKDKLLTIQMLSQVGIPVPKTMLYTSATTLPVIKQEFSFPLVLKVIGGSKGDGVVLVKDEKQLENILRIVKGGNLQEELIIQEMIVGSQGRDLRVMISGGKAFACIQRTAAPSDGFRSNYSSGGSVNAFELTDDIIELANKTAETMGLFIGGIDLLFSNDGFVVCEVNSIPGFYLPKNPDIWKVDVPGIILSDIRAALSA